MTSTTDSDEASNWPLHKIAEIHESNDVVLDEYLKQDNFPSEQNTTTTAPFRSSSIGGISGNERFHQLLMKHSEEYKIKSPMEKPSVTIKIIKEWRNQSPPGRFLVAEEGSNPPLYKDVGDKKARAKISKALKMILSPEENKDSSDLPRRESTNTESTKSISSCSSSAAEPPSGPQTTIHQTEEDKDAPLNLPPRPETGVRRSVSQALQQPSGQKLYGRHEEYERLGRILERNQPGVVDLVVIAGVMGSGKTTLAHQVVPAWRRQQHMRASQIQEYEEDEGMPQTQAEPFFLVGKFEQYKWNLPNSVYVDLVTEFCTQLEKRNDKPLARRYHQRIKELLREDLGLLMDMVPQLREFMLIKPAPLDKSVRESTTEESRGTERTSSTNGTSTSEAYESVAAQRVQIVVNLFFRALAEASPRHKIIILFEDLQYASEGAVGIFGNLVGGENSTSDILYCATYRNDPQTHCKPYLHKRIDHLKCVTNVKVHEMFIQNLSEASVQEMLADALHLVEHETRSLSSLVFGLTQGNPTFITEVLRMLQDQGALYHDETSKQWTCELADIGINMKKIKCALDLWKAKASDLPQDCQKTLLYASALMCPHIKESTLRVVNPASSSSISSHLQAAEAKGLILHMPNAEEEWTFKSDGVRQAIYDMIPEKERPNWHLKIGQRLWGHCEPGDCILLMQLWMSHHLVTQDEDLRTVASIFLYTAKNAAKRVGFQTAWYALSGAITMAKKLKDPWGRGNYDLSLDVFNTAIEVCYFNGEYTEELQELIDDVMCHARTFEDSLIARSTLVRTLGTQNKRPEAIKLALETVDKLGEPFPSNPCQMHVDAEYRKAKRLLKGKTDDDILELPRMRNPQKVAAQQMLAHAYLYACSTSEHLAALMAFRMLTLTVNYGLSGMSSMAFGIYAITLCRFDHKEGFRYGRLALKICDIFKRDVWFSRSAAAFYGIAYCRQKPVKETQQPLVNARRAALRSGDIEYAMLNGSLELWNVGALLSVPELERRCRELRAEACYHGQLLSVAMIKPLQQYALNLMGRVEGDPKILQGDLVDKDIDEAKSGACHFQHASWINFYALKLAFLFGDMDLAATYAHSASRIYGDNHGHMTGAFAVTYECLVLLALARSGKGRLRNMLKVRKLLKRLKDWSAGCPENFLDKQCLVEAELAWASGKITKAKSRFRLAIVESRDQGFWLEEAVGHEQLGKLYLEEKDEAAAIPFLRAAQRVYETMGANAKAQHMEDKYGDLWHC